LPPFPVNWAQGLLVAGLAAFSLTCIAAAHSSEGWTTFTNRAGWSIKYPPHWEVGSCKSCRDLTDPRVFVTFLDPSTKGIVMIQHLKDKPANESVDAWLDDVKQVVANPRTSEEWTSLDGRRALKVSTRNPDGTESENIYAVDGTKTFFLQASPVGDTLFYRLYRQMLSTFRFAKR
jgi:hypothetical protein